MGGFEIINGLGLPPPISCIAGFRKNQWVRSSCKFALCQPTQFLVGGNIRYLLNERSTRLFNYQLYMAALCANGGERKLFGGTFGGISKDVMGKCLYISMYFYCLFCSYYLNQVVTNFSFITIFSFSFSRTCFAWYRCL